jgi:uncharacterized protein YbcI
MKIMSIFKWISINIEDKNININYFKEQLLKIYQNMISYKVLPGDSYSVLTKLTENPDERGKYRLIVTSPPYYRHRHYGQDPNEIGQEKTDEMFIEKLFNIFTKSRELLTEDGSLWIVIGDTRRKYGKLMIPHRLLERILSGIRKIIFLLVQKKIFLRHMKLSSFSQRMTNVLQIWMV